jgi:hypothetical protein
VRGTVIITHGRAKRRMVKHAIAVGAASARGRLPELIGETFRRAAAAGAPRDAVTPGPVGSTVPPPAAGTPA